MNNDEDRLLLSSGDDDKDDKQLNFDEAYLKAEGGKLNDSSFFDDDKIDTIPEDPKVRRTLSSKPSMIKPKTFAFDESSIQLNQMIKESSLGPAGCKTTKNGDSRLKKIKAENRQLRE